MAFRFQDRPVMTASVTLRMLSKIAYSLSDVKERGGAVRCTPHDLPEKCNKTGRNNLCGMPKKAKKKRIVLTVIDRTAKIFTICMVRILGSGKPMV